MGTKKNNSTRNRAAVRLVLIVLLLLTLAGLGGWGLVLFKERLFEANNHFILRRVVVKSGGWWKSREGELCLLLGLSRGETNLFSIDIPGVKGKVLAEPAVAGVSVYKVLPDTLVVEITERIPKAYLFRYGNKTVVDEAAVLMSTDSCASFSREMPVVTGIRASEEELRPGKVLEQVLPALELIDAAYSAAPRVFIRHVSLSSPTEFNANIVDVSSGRSYDLLMQRVDLRDTMIALDRVLDEIELIEEDVKVIDMRYKEQAVLR